ncbi:MAG: class I SAM-dependent methyltransferase [Lachnospiraceae bacterium]|nr:class I SAM-dependent methyltransferase [Lachnospiraceae bacterium]
MQLSKRLAAVADMVTPGFVLADIGTDHAYIPIYLVEQQVIPRAIAADVNRGPLARANAHIRQHALAGKIETRLSDGLAAFLPGEAQSIVIAGMGGALTVRILANGGKNGAVLTRERQEAEERKCQEPDGRERREMDGQECGTRMELILQPQSEIVLVRSWLEENGWKIVREDMVFEDGKYYPMMKAKRCPAYSGFTQSEEQAGAYQVKKTPSSSAPSAMNETELWFGPRLLEMRHPVLRQFLLRERVTQENVLKSLEQGKSEASRAREREVRRNIERINEALRLYGENEAPGFVF